MKRNRGLPKMQNPPPPPPRPAPTYRLRLYHCGSWYLAFGENGKLIETSKITIEENFPDKGQEATIRMPVEIVNEEPGSVTRIETETKCGTSFSFSGYSGDIDKLRAEVCKLREEVETLRRAQPKSEAPKYAVAGGKLFKCENGMWWPVKTEAEEAAEALEKDLEPEINRFKDRLVRALLRLNDKEARP